MHALHKKCLALLEQGTFKQRSASTNQHSDNFPFILSFSLSAFLLAVSFTPPAVTLPSSIHIIHHGGYKSLSSLHHISGVLWSSLL